MELYLLDENAQRMKILPEYESLVWRTGLMTSSADLKVLISCFNDISKATYLERSDTDTILFINSKKVIDKTGERGCYLSAYDPVELLRRRVLFGTRDFSHSRAEIVRRLVDAGFNRVANTPSQLLPSGSRLIELFVNRVANDNAGAHLGESLTCQVSWGNVYEHIESILEGMPIRFFSRFATASERHILPVLYEGKDLTQEVIFSTKYGDLFDVEYSFESVDRKNVAVVGGQGEGAARIVDHATMSSLDVPYGELWIDANDVGTDDGNLTIAQVRSHLRTRGIEKLREQPCEHALMGSVSQARFQYGLDYQVADRVSYEAFGQRHEDTISEIEEVFEKQNSRINITIGTTYPTIRQIVERN